ncbi:ABC-2 type transport system permease protein [Edaphobacter aggregans]|jgi:ABC-2 type transport system permease protein|uniref:ABC-2 type transport system permease protein n=1 Tax=Edaphobacter aggregans TaxID=570835 RepID=A0A3R9R2F3_9BACT|nr:ABC transporter permease [Edaphobacter aggregans]RSL16312.1 ABC-2 type transport system permease protein [Edaphobacter aggregans]
MHNVWLIAKREYLERVRTKAFLISTILIPVLMGGGIVGSIISGSKAKSTSHITIVSQDQQLATDLQAELQSGKDSRMTVDVISPGNDDTRKTLDAMLADKQIDGYLWITPAANPGERPNFSFTPRSAADISTKGVVSSALRTVLMRERLAHQGMVASDVESLMQPVQVDTTQAGKNADTVSSFVAIYVLFFLMYMVILLYGMNVARSIIEEKTSRVFEVLLATIKPEEMMAGKVIGVGSVGLTQVAVWLLTAVILTSSSIVGALAGGKVHVSLNPMQIIFFVVYFLLGYLLYSSIAAALGAMVNSEQELQQLNMILVMPLAGCMFALAPVITNPNGLVARVISFIPFCTPLIMYLRISLATPPAWEIALSIALMMVTIYAILWVASRIYRVGILMYGKKPNLPEILRWLKYS